MCSPAEQKEKRWYHFTNSSAQRNTSIKESLIIRRLDTITTTFIELICGKSKE